MNRSSRVARLPAGRQVRAGFSLIEIIISIAVIAAIAVAAGSLLSASAYRRAAFERSRAVILSESALDAARALKSGALLDRTDAYPLGAPDAWGTFTIRAAATAPSAPNVFAASATSTPVAGVTAAIRIPAATSLAGNDITASLSLPTGTPASGSAGFMVRTRDLENGYRYRLNTTTAVFESLTDGTATSLLSKTISNAAGSWHSVHLDATGSTFKLYFDGTLLGTVTDTKYTAGAAMLIAANYALPWFDNVSLSGIGFWNFDQGSAPSSTPLEWRRVSAATLPGGSITQTISTTFPSSTLKTVTAVVRWLTSRGPASSTVSTYHP